MNFVIVNIILIVVVLFQGKESFLNEMWVFYTIHYITLFLHIFFQINKKCNYLFIAFSPIVLSFIYTGVFFTLGSYVIPRGYGFFLIPYETFPEIDNLNYYTIYLFVTNILILFFWNFLINKKVKTIEKKLNAQEWMSFKYSNFIFFCILFLLLSFTKLSFLGSISGVFLYPFKFITIIGLVLVSISLSIRKKIALYVLLMILVSIYHYHSKREIILVLFAIIFLEFLYNKLKLKLSFKTFSIMLILAGVMCYSILAASILRGYGGYKLNNKFEAFLKVPDYIQKDYFLDVAVANFEINYMFGNTILCMNLVENGKLPLQYGSSYFKFLFSPIPRSIWKNKPDGIILKYSYALDPNYKKIGQSMPVVHYGEGFVNFYWLGFIVATLIIVVFEYLYWCIIETNWKSIFNWKFVFFIYINCIIFQYIRGSGFDLFMLYVTASLPMILFIKLLKR
ncbi:hypothetical protein D7030_06935 [Flavobacteriaceae bacterium AU392]|nr:hypothetical protein D1817_01485 [Flavobacteriaceae bacterium]RKM84863.1 hypothetical protein D7030_06935 [Flavobacteriaceae bacterium AU392]